VPDKGKAMKNIEAQKTNGKVKNSLVLSGLVGTAGLFIAKLLGLLYSIPLSYIFSSDALMQYYGTSYNIYSYILNVFTAGIPFAISTIVAKYTILDDNKSLRKIRTMSIRLLGLLGFFGMLALVLLSGVIANIIVPGEDMKIMRTCLQLLAAALVFVPILSAYRGFWQGRKEMGEYAFTQVFEQIVRVGFLLTAASLIVYVFHMDRKYALYAAVLSTSIAAVAAIIQIYVFDKKNFKEIKDKAAVQTTLSRKNEELLHELIILAIPYLLSAIIGYCDQIYYSILLPVGLRLHGYDAENITVISSAFNYVGNKLTSIPQILAPGFIAALIPHVTEAMTQKNYSRVSKIIVECIGIVFFIGSAASLCIAIYSSDIYHILFYTVNPTLSSEVIKWVAADGFMGTICPVTSMLSIALGMQKKVLKRQLIDAVIRGILMVPLTYVIGYQGAIIASLIGSTYLLIANIYGLQKQFNIDAKRMIINLAKIVLALVIMTASCLFFKKIGLDGAVGGKLTALLKFFINVVLSLIIYLGISQALKIPQDLFHRKLSAIFTSRIRHKDAN
jgi:O-antigen/teichoic acid export membrane protein